MVIAVDVEDLLTLDAKDAVFVNICGAYNIVRRTQKAHIPSDLQTSVNIQGTCD